MPTNKIKSLCHHHLDQYLQIVFALVFQIYWGLVLSLIKIVRFKSKMIVINVEDGLLFPWCIVTWLLLLLHDCYYYYSYFHLCVRFKNKVLKFVEAQTKETSYWKCMYGSAVLLNLECAICTLCWRPKWIAVIVIFDFAVLNLTSTNK